MRTPQYDMQVFKDRRQRLAERAQGSAVVIPAHPEYIRNNDCHYPYRQDSNLFYLTGYEEPNSLLVFRPGKSPETILFVMPKDPLRETWDGFRYGPDAAKTLFQVDATYTIDKAEEELTKLLKEVDKVYYSFFINKDFDNIMMRVSESITWARSRTNRGNLPFEDVRPLVGELRIRKTGVEIEYMRKAAQISAEAHVEVMRECKPGKNERALYGTFIKAMMERGAAREGYNAIVAGGANATTLHYVFNDQALKDGEMLLIDAGAEYNFYSGDITRTYPINGKFTPAQKRVYQKVLEVQKDLVASVRPGETREGLQKKTIDRLVDVMLDENILRGKKSDIIQSKDYFKYYMHGVSHWLGLDVHDTGVTEINNEPRPLEPGFCLTIEPGLYIPHDDQDVPKELRGLGIRIEDDMLVTVDGAENLTQACPKEVDELESIIGTR